MSDELGAVLQKAGADVVRAVLQAEFMPAVVQDTVVQPVVQKVKRVVQEKTVVQDTEVKAKPIPAVVPTVDPVRSTPVPEIATAPANGLKTPPNKALSEFWNSKKG